MHHAVAAAAAAEKKWKQQEKDSNDGKRGYYMKTQTRHALTRSSCGKLAVKSWQQLEEEEDEEQE